MAFRLRSVGVGGPVGAGEGAQEASRAQEVPLPTMRPERRALATAGARGCRVEMGADGTRSGQELRFGEKELAGETARPGRHRSACAHCAVPLASPSAAKERGAEPLSL